MGVGIASAGISLGLFIGVAASFVYIILAGIKWASERLDPPQDSLDIDRCARCGCKFVDVEDGTCSMCDLTICAHCSIRYKQTWLCATCIKRRDSELIGNNWVLSKYRERIDGTLPSAKYGRRECDVRDFVEKLTENILGGRLDDVRIDYLTEDPQYVHFMDKYEDVLSLTISRLITAVQLIVDGVDEGKKESPRKIHDQLKSLLHSSLEGKGRNFGTKTYEDILSTAILNKIIQNVNLGRFQSRMPPLSSKSYKTGRFDGDVQEEIYDDFQQYNSNLYDNLDVNLRKNSGMWPEQDVDILDELLHSDKKIEDIELWKENWVLGKKSNGSSVAMLIPSPNGKVRPLIGDLEVDQLSDLSDIEDEHFLLKESRKNSMNTMLNENANEEQNKPNGVIDVQDGPRKNSFSTNLKSELNGCTVQQPIVEAKNTVFSSTDSNSDDDTSKKEKDREFSEVTHRNTTKVTIFHMEPIKDQTLNRKDRLSVKQLAKHFSEQAAGQTPHSVHSLTGRNLMRDRSSSPLHSNIEYWEGKAKMMKK
ncbi:uncharacterized protein LOC106667177 isoform X2 [Cimex lectularius]|uniref:Uncharacterized protein n=1 Tax=Cimex lectularius TaxID=79782 RepID=A0A8I6RSX5_CIMLE|nr:uncharacterized protein LOC106667177 isoform X2 [Cimex lectularius]